MSLIVEDGTGIRGAESYATVAFIDAYWAARTHLAFSATWGTATTAKKEGAAREATAYLDGTWGPYYRGEDRGYVQGLLWPRSNALDDAGYPLPEVPPELLDAEAELAGRAITAPLAADLDRGGMIKSLKAGSVEIVYVDGAPARPTYGVISLSLSPILNGSQPNAPSTNWAWA